MVKRFSNTLAGCFIFAVLIALACPGSSLALDKVTLRLQWVHQSQFAGFYLAQDAGLYKKAGLEVKILPGGPGILPLKELAENKFDFATAWLSGALEMRSKGVPIVSLAQIIQHSALLLVAMADGDIENIEDLNGRRVGLWGGHFSLAPRALFARKGITVKEVPQNASVTPLIKGAVAAAGAMRFNEYHQLYQAGVDWEDLVVMDFADMGLNFPEDGVYTLESTWKQRPGVCKRFTKASLDGWRMALDRPEAALAAVMKRVDASHLASNSGHQKWMLRTMSQLITHRVGRSGLGRLSARDYDVVQKVLLDQGFIEKPVPITEFAVPAIID